MKLSSLSFADQAFIPEQFAFGRIDPAMHVALADNINPHLVWDEVPSATRSFAVVCHDPDVPTKADDVNQEGRTVLASLPRTTFYHWALIDLQADRREIDEGEFSNGVTPRGKGGPLAPDEARQGINDYTHWFAADRDMSGEYFGYDGPCPPWNDEIVHHYVFTVYALSIDKLPLDGSFTAAQVIEVIAPYVLDQASLTGIYTLNPELAPKKLA